jgi:hypothetical protein
MQRDKVTCREHGQPICYICLDKGCSGKRLLCDGCIRERKNHRGHKIAFVNENIEPFSRLCCNCHLPNSTKMYAVLIDRAFSLDRIVRNVEAQVNAIFARMREKIVQPIATLAGTYNSEAVYKSIEAIQTHHDNNEVMDRIASSINYLVGMNEYTSDNGHIEFMEKESEKILTEAGKKIQIVMEVMES